MCDSVVKQIISTSKKLDHCWIGSEYLKQRKTEKVYNLSSYRFRVRHVLGMLKFNPVCLVQEFQNSAPINKIIFSPLM